MREKPTATDVVRHESMEQDAFIVDDEFDVLDDEGKDDDAKGEGKDN